jgi:hypothetical protein
MLKFLKRQPKKLKDEVVEAAPAEPSSEDHSYDLPVANEGQVTISATGVSPADGALLVGFFISNGLSQKVKFETVPLVLLDSEKRVLARQSFDGESIGEVAGSSSKACVVRFDEDNVFDQDIPEDYQICFDVPVKPIESNQIQYQSLPENISPDQEQKLKSILANLPPMKYGEVNFSPLQAQISAESRLLATVIIRNYSDTKLNIRQIPLVIYDAQKEELARGQFNIEDLSVEPFKALPWTFDFGPILQDKEVDLSRWYINLYKNV